MALKGKETGKETVTLLLADGIKVTISADLWSKNGCALLGILLHGILRHKLPNGTYQWCMVEQLAGAVPCRSERHTGEYVFEASIALPSWKSLASQTSTSKSSEGKQIAGLTW